MRIGEILHRDGLVGAEELANALAEHRIAGKRVCSLLIARGAVDADQVARALAEQHGVSAALKKHLANRDHALAKLLPSGIARKHYALPIGRLRDGEIVICVRDPKPGLQAAFERIVNKPVLIVVAAACVIDPLIDATYAPLITQELTVPLARPALAQRPPAMVSFATGTESGVPLPTPEEIEIDMDSGADFPALALVNLDDAGVAKEFTVHDTRMPTMLPSKK